MSFSSDEYLKLRKKRLEEQAKKNEQKKASQKSTTKSKTPSKMSDGDSFAEEYLSLRQERLANQKKDNDIAPVRTTTSVTKKEEEEDDGFDFFQKGALKDGITVGNVTQAILGTVGDIGTGVVKGASKMVGGILDAGAYGVAGIADKVGADDFANELRVKARENTIDKAFEKTDTYLDQYSLLGKTSDSVAEGLGQVASIILTGGAAGAAGLGAVGASAVTAGAMGVSSFGAGMSEAYESGATDEEAATYGLIKGVVDAGSEMIFGGLGKTVKALGISKGLSSLDDVFAQKLASKITNHTARNFVEFGVKASAEGVEEVLAGIGSAVGKKLTYMEEKELSDLVKDENLLEQFVVGAVTSGISQSGLVPGMKHGGLVESVQKDRDFISGLSTNEQKVVDKVHQSLIEEAEKGGKNLSNKEKDKLYDEVLEQMDRGEISLDTIEEVLGGDSYKAYKDAVDKENEVLKEFADLYEGDELIQQIADFMETAESKTLKTKLSDDVFGMVKEDRLVGSYVERSNRGRAFEADLSKYDEKRRAIVQNAINSGILNNTRRTHEFVDLIAKISADKGVPFDFTNNEKLKGSIYAVDGKIVNGFVTADGITLNIDSAKSLNTVVGHEITHVLEGTELYTELQNILFQYAQSRKAVDSKFDNEYKERLYNVRQMYKDVDGYQGVEGFNKIKNEVAADLVGDYLFTDSDFIHNLSTNHRNVFQKIYDEIKYLCKVATAGSKEARELEKVKRAFEKAYKEGGKAQSDTKYSVSEIPMNQRLSGDELLDAEDLIAEIEDVAEISPNGYVTVYHRTTEENAKRIMEIGKMSAKEDGIFFSTQKDGLYSVDYGSGVVELRVPVENLVLDDIFDSEAHLRIPLENRNKILDVSAYLPNANTDAKRSISDSDGNPIDSARISDNEYDTKYSLSHNPEIAKGQSDYVLNPDKKSYISEEELKEAQRVTNAMVDVMMKYSSILPEDKIGKVLTKNGSYDRSVENTTICVRTLAYNEFVDKVQEEIGRPLTQMESFLVSQKLYDIAVEPQCLYCYVSLDRKAFNDMLLRYMQDRDTVIAKYNNSDKSPAAIDALYEEFLHGRKPTKEMKSRFDAWISYVDNGTQLLSLADIATEDRQSVIKANGGNLATQLADARKYAQSASWSKIQKSYVAYRDEILKLGDRVVKNLNEHYGLRWYSFSDYSAAFIVENMQQITDASIRGLKGLAYTKDTDFAEIFAPSGMNINVSVFVNQDKDGNFFIDEKQSANFEKALELRERYPNVGIVATVTNDDALRWAGSQEWSDVIIPFHIVRTGTDVAEYYKWLNYTAESADTIKDKDIWNSYLDSLNLKSDNARKKVSKNIYPNEHKNDKATYLNLCESRGLSPRFVRFAGEDWYMKLVNETRLSADASSPLKPVYNEDAAKQSFQKFVDKGGYEGGWYNDGVDVDAEARVVADDVLAGRKANEVSYGRQDGFAPEDLIASRKTNRKHGQLSLSEEGAEHPVYGNYNVYGKDVALAPTTEDSSTVAENATVPEVPEEDIAPYDDDGRFESLTDADAPPVPDKPIKTVEDRHEAKLNAVRTELSNNHRLREESRSDFDQEISRLRAEYDAKKDKTTKSAQDILRRIERKARLRDSVDASYAKRISDLEARVERMNSKQFRTAEQRRTKQQEYTEQMANLVGDTSTWKDKALGISYRVNTLRRNLRDIVRDASGKRDIAKADAIYNELQGKYNTHEALLNREANRIKEAYAKMKITAAEDAYIQMLGEFRHNPDTTLTEDAVKDFYEKHKNSIDEAKVDKAIAMARQTYDELLVRVNEVLREQGMKEIPYRKGYFPHFTEEKQGFLAKLFNWKIQNNDIPTDIAGLTEQFNPNRSWQSFNKQRKGDVTDYSFTKGLDTYVQGSLDWIYHIEDIQKRRAFENHIRYIHSEKGVQEKIDAIKSSDEYDADEVQDQIDLVLREAGNPLNNFVTDLRAGTNRLANKKSSLDRGVEELTNRKFYSVMTNISNRVSANMVGGSVSSALTNFIPITQSWGEVSPISSLRAMGDTMRSTFRDDGMIEKSDFLTNRLNRSENLYKTTWDKVSDKVGLMMEAVDSFTSQTVWRSKYLENISNGMSESEAIKNADQFAEGVMAGRSRGNQPTIFDSKNPLVKTLTAFQLEVANQYGYMFKDMPQDMKDKSVAKLVKGYATMFMGAYAYNALYSSLTGRDAAFDPIGIIEELLRDMGLLGDDEEEEPVDTVMNLTNNILEEVPFVGGLLGGGRVPISSAIPYDGNVVDIVEGASKLLLEGDTSDLTSEWLKPMWYVALPMGGGQIKKTIQGLGMFSGDHPVAGSYTDSGNLRYPVEDTLLNRVQAGIFGQYANKNARDYFDNERTALKEKQIQEFIDLDMPIRDYWDYREELKEQETLEDKFDYIAGLDLSVEQKNIMINNVVDRKNDVDLSNYDDFSGYDEFDFYSKNTEKYEFLQHNGVSYEDYIESDDSKEKYNAIYSWWKNNPEKVTVSKAVTDNVVEYREYTSALNDIRADKDSDGDSIRGSAKEKKVAYINSLDIDYGARLILFKSEYKSDDTYNRDIIEYLNNRADISYEEMETILKELGFEVDSKGNISW